MLHEIHIVQSEPTLIAVIRGRVASQQLPQFVPAACGEVWSFFRTNGLPKPGRHVAVYKDALISLEVGAEVTSTFAGNERVQCSNLPEGRAAHTVHYGPYPGLSAAHQAIHNWCKAQHHRLSGVRWEVYGHWEERWNSDPSRIRTDVYYQLID